MKREENKKSKEEENIDKIDTIIGKRLKKLREKDNLSQRKFIRKFIENLKNTKNMDISSLMSQTSISNYESGKRSVPNLILLEYAKYFNVSLDYIYGRIDEPQGVFFGNNLEEIEFVNSCFNKNGLFYRRLKKAIQDTIDEKK